ncbi:alpha/beta hydrolase family protein [Bradyrhizobium sp. BR 1433]|uniref:alpha/beta hydrolase family protein n=1 Tax=Bradyrhizobium sp. BR 1433 TaxID=3447967 RepID=UPI003EE56110
MLKETVGGPAPSSSARHPSSDIYGDRQSLVNINPPTPHDLHDDGQSMLASGIAGRASFVGPSGSFEELRDIGTIVGEGWEHGSRLASDILIDVQGNINLLPNQFGPSQFTINGERYSATLGPGGRGDVRLIHYPRARLKVKQPRNSKPTICPRVIRIVRAGSHLHQQRTRNRSDAARKAVACGDWSRHVGSDCLSRRRLKSHGRQIGTMLSGCLDYLSSRPDVDARRIGIYGEGLSAALATDFAVSDSRVVAAVCDCGFWSLVRLLASVDWMARMTANADVVSELRSRLVRQLRCPALVVAGGSNIVSVSEAVTLQADCMAARINVELAIGHTADDPAPAGEIENFVSFDDRIFGWLEHKLHIETELRAQYTGIR